MKEPPPLEKWVCACNDSNNGTCVPSNTERCIGAEGATSVLQLVIMRIQYALFVTLMVTITATGLTASSSVSASVFRPVRASAVTNVTNHPDSGVQGTWANDNFVRRATITLSDAAPVSDCGGNSPCWRWIGKITDNGTFTTIAGAAPPRDQASLDQSLTGQFAGGTTTVRFFADSANIRGSRVPRHVDGAVSGRRTSTNWVEQFFPRGTVFNSAANPGGPDLGRWSWAYTLGFNANNQCPNVAFRWVDSAVNGGGSRPADGNVLTPNTADCGTQGD